MPEHKPANAKCDCGAPACELHSCQDRPTPAAACEFGCGPADESHTVPGAMIVVAACPVHGRQTQDGHPEGATPAPPVAPASAARRYHRWETVEHPEGGTALREIDATGEVEALLAVEQAARSAVKRSNDPALYELDDALTRLDEVRNGD